MIFVVQLLQNCGLLATTACPLAGRVISGKPAAPGGALAVSEAQGAPFPQTRGLLPERDLLVLTSLLLPLHWPEGHQACGQRPDGLEKTACLPFR